MNKINSFDELKLLVDKFKSSLYMRENYTKEKITKREILVCGGTGCTSSSSKEIINNLKSEIEKANLQNQVQVHLTGCFGFCAKGPIVKVFPDNIFYINVSPSDAEEIVNKHLINNTIIDRLLFEEPSLNNKKVEKHDDMSFYKKQFRIALRNCGTINPENINEYIGCNGYLALGKCLTELSQQEVISEVKNSGLRGRGGAGFPTGIKWESTAQTPKGNKYVICNADEGDPGAFMDRSILEGDPHSVL